MFGTPYKGTRQAKAFVLKPKNSRMTAMLRNRLVVVQCMELGYAPTKYLVNHPARRLGS